MKGTLTLNTRPTRAKETRDADIRAVIDQLSSSPLHIPEHQIPDDSEYSWVRESTLGEYDAGNVTEKTRLMWRPVPADRHTGMSFQSAFPGRRPESEEANIIRYRGLVLCERPKKIGDAIRAHRNKEYLETLQSTPGMEHLSTGYVRANKTEGPLSARGDAFME